MGVCGNRCDRGAPRLAERGLPMVRIAGQYHQYLYRIAAFEAGGANRTRLFAKPLPVHAAGVCPFPDDLRQDGDAGRLQGARFELCCGKDYRKIPSRLCGAAGERAGDRRYARVPESFRQSIAGGAACRKGGPFVGFRPVCSCRYVFDHSRGGDLPAFGYDRNV